MPDINEIAIESQVAFENSDWNELTSLSKELLIILGKDPQVYEPDLRIVAKRYLSAIVGDGRYLLGNDEVGRKNLESGMQELGEILKKSPRSIITLLTPELKNISQIQLFILNPRPDRLNKAAASLRRIGRPDLSIELTSSQILKTRFNYYSLVVRGSSYIDLGSFEKGISDGEVALTYSPKETANYAHIVLARGFREIFKRDGEIAHGEVAFEHAKYALRIKRDAHIARVYISIAAVLGITDDYEVSKLVKEFRLDANQVDHEAIEISSLILGKISETEIFNETDMYADDLEDLENLDETSDDESEEKVEDYYEDYFEEYTDSLANPQMPHLEP